MTEKQKRIEASQKKYQKKHRTLKEVRKFTT